MAHSSLVFLATNNLTIATRALWDPDLTGAFRAHEKKSHDVVSLSCLFAFAHAPMQKCFGLNREMTGLALGTCGYVVEHWALVHPLIIYTTALVFQKTIS